MTNLRSRSCKVHQVLQDLTACYEPCALYLALHMYPSAAVTYLSWRKPS
jgi:hypothetical protein